MGSGKAYSTSIFVLDEPGLVYLSTRYGFSGGPYRPSLSSTDGMKIRVVTAEMNLKSGNEKRMRIESRT